MPIFGVTASSNMSTKLTDFYQIATTTVGSGGASSITFSSIPQDYTHLQIRGIAKYSASLATGSLNFNGDIATNYSTHVLYGDGASISAVSGVTVNFMYAFLGAGSTPSNVFSNSVIDILDYTNTNKYKTIRSLTGVDINGAGGYVEITSGSWRNTASVTSLTLTPSSNLTQYSSFALYGIKG